MKIQSIEENKALDFQVDDLIETITFSIFADKESENFDLELNTEKKEERKEVIYGNVLQLTYNLTQVFFFYLNDKLTNWKFSNFAATI